MEQLKTALEGRYTIERLAGEGGMATVYVARDVRHNRKVALKVLRPDLGAVVGVDRFLSEIQVTANLQHPNLLPLFDSGEAGGLLFYVMPFIEGESLRARLDREKQLPVDDAVRIATAIANALDYAHRHGVIHRDLKPENILMHEGQPLVADFGIALAVSNAGGARITQTGISLGTPQYMSPEQATGDRSIDARTDIYSVGAILYEMLTGEPPYLGTTSQAIIARVLTEKPRRVRLSRPNVPVHVEDAVACALEKLPADRFASAHEFANALQGRATHSTIPSASAVTTGERKASAAPARRFRTFAVAGWATAVVALVAAGWAFTRPRSEPLTTRFALNFEPRERFSDGIGNPMAVSPDGNTIVYTATRGSTGSRLYLRPAGDLVAHEIPGTDGALQPAFSPDGKWVAFVTPGQLKKVAASGGAPVLIAPILSSSVRGLSWTPTGDILIGRNGNGLEIVSTDGTKRELTTTPPYKSGSDQRWPLVLPDGEHAIYVTWSGALGRTALWRVRLSDGRADSLGWPGTTPLGVIDGHLIYVSVSGSLMALPVKSDGRPAGRPVPTGIDSVAVDPSSAQSRVAVSASGSLLYQTGSLASNIVITDVHGITHTVIGEEAIYSFPRFSPNGNQFAVAVGRGPANDIWIYNRQAQTFARLTTTESNDRPEWSPDGRHVLYRSTARGQAAMMWQPADHSGAPTVLVQIDTLSVNEGIMSPDGKTLMFRAQGRVAQYDFFYRSMTGDTSMKPFIVTPAYEAGIRFSPNGRWVAYSSDEAENWQVYITPFPGPGPRYLVSKDGGSQPVWSPDGKRLFYMRGRQIMAASVTLEPEFKITSTDVMFEGTFVSNYVHASYDVSPDGKQFLMLKAGGDPTVVIVRDWILELRQRLRGN